MYIPVFELACFVWGTISVICRKRYRRSFSGLEKNLKSGNLVVEDQLFRKHGLMNKLSSTGKISDMLRAMAVTGKKQRQIIFAAASKDLETVFSCVATIAIRCKRSFVDLKDRAGFPGSPCKRIIINRVMSVITMSEDLYTGVFHYIDKSFCVFGSGTAAVIPGMHAGNGVIKFA